MGFSRQKIEINERGATAGAMATGSGLAGEPDLRASDEMIQRKRGFRCTTGNASIGCGSTGASLSPAYGRGRDAF